VLRNVLLASFLVFATTPVLHAIERILLHRIGPSQSTVFIANADGSNERPLLRTSGFDCNASFSADGKWIVFTSESGGSADVYLVDPGGSGLERVTDDPAYDDQGALSPDGKQLAFVSSSGTGSADIWVLDLQTKKAQNLTHAPGSFRPSWSPDGKRIVYRFWSETEYGLRSMNLDDGSSTQLTSGFDNSPAWSPKGDLIVFTRLSEDDYDIYTIRPDGTDLKRLTSTPGNDAHFMWSPDGKHILFSSVRLGFKDEGPLYDDIPQPYGELFVMNADGSGQPPLTDNQWEDAMPAWAPVPLR
jgi:Tol biopolymer transport system component